MTPWRAARVACMTTVLGGLVAPAGAAGLSAWQEIVLLTVAKAQHATQACGFRLSQGKVEAMLGSAGLAADAPARVAVSPSLRRQIVADADAYRGDRAAACADAWDRFGSDATPGMRDLLTR